jgi:DNA repair protein RadD
MLREYQQRALDMLFEYFQHHDGHPCLVLPTGAGKSHIIAEFCRLVVMAYPDQRILMLTHVKELIEQNAEKMRQHWPDAPLGVYSAGLRQRDAGQSITFAGIQSVAKKVDLLGRVDIVIIDEAHRINHTADGHYRRLIAQLTAKTPDLKVIGLTATPYRLGHGYITDAPALFTDLIEPIGVMDLVKQGYLAPLRSLATATQFDLAGVKKKGGEYVEADLDAAVNTKALNKSVADEIVEKAYMRQSWLVFCVNVSHAFAMRDALREKDVIAETIVGTTPAEEREEIIRAFKAGEIRALTNANVLTTGFDAPNVDVIACCRPTLSTSLYVQMLGRGTRLKDNMDDCLVLDFAGLTYTHGLFDDPVVKKPKKTEGGEAPAKACPNCQSLCHTAVRVCPYCGFVFPPPKPPDLELKIAPIMSDEAALGREMNVASWRWDIHNNGQDMLRVRYYPASYTDPIVTEYFTVWHGGAASYRAWEKLKTILSALGISKGLNGDQVYEELQTAPAPTSITYRQESRFFRVVDRQWAQSRRAF